MCKTRVKQALKSHNNLQLPIQQHFIDNYQVYPQKYSSLRKLEKMSSIRNKRKSQNNHFRRKSPNYVIYSNIFGYRPKYYLLTFDVELGKIFFLSSIRTFGTFFLHLWASSEIQKAHKNLSGSKNQPGNLLVKFPLLPLTSSLPSSCLKEEERRFLLLPDHCFSEILVKYFEIVGIFEISGLIS